ncbi:MAG: helix-turn-helix domain-containing protein [Atopobiaceae bacterium]
MLVNTMDIEQRSRWLRSTPGPLELAQPFYCTEAGCFYARRNYVASRSHTNSYLVFYTLSGAGEVYQGGQLIRVGKGQALLLDCSKPHRFRTAHDRRHWYHLWANIDGEGVRTLATLISSGRSEAVSVDDALIRQGFDQIFGKLEQENARAITSLGLGVHQILSAMVTAASDDEHLPWEQTAVGIAQSYVANHFTENITVADMAEAASVSSSYLIRLFKRSLGTTPYNYLLRFRITKARQLLDETNKPVVQIAHDVGFSNESNFSFRFSKMVGLSPRAYRMSNVGGGIAEVNKTPDAGAAADAAGENGAQADGSSVASAS